MVLVRGKKKKKKSSQKAFTDVGGESRALWSQFNRSIFGFCHRRRQISGGIKRRASFWLFETKKGRRKSCRANAIRMDCPLPPPTHPPLQPNVAVRRLGDTRRMPVACRTVWWSRSGNGSLPVKAEVVAVAAVVAVVVAVLVGCDSCRC